jgi:hypothetical protein
MALRMVWCVLLRRGTTAFRGKTIFDEAGRFTCEMDLSEGMGYTVRAALLHGVRQHEGEEADVGGYRLDVYEDAEHSEVLLAGFTVPQDAAVYRPAGSLADYGDDELVSELASRLRGRT